MAIRYLMYMYEVFLSCFQIKKGKLTVKSLTLQPPYQSGRHPRVTIHRPTKRNRNLAPTPEDVEVATYPNVSNNKALGKAGKWPRLT